MQFLIKLIDAKKVIEIGACNGYSALCMDSGLSSDGYILACYINKDWTKIAEEFWKLSGCRHLIDLKIGPTIGSIKSM